MRSEVIKLYPGRDDVTLTTYILSDSREMLKGAKRPAVLICPGGAYLNCSDREGEPVAMRFAAMGYHAFVLRYSVYYEGKDGFPVMDGPVDRKDHCVHPNPVRDIAKAMIVINESSENWLVDTDRIAVCGFSAGAHNSAMYSVYWNKPILTEFFGVSEDTLKPAAAILAYTLSDYYLMRESAGDGFAKKLFELSNLAISGSVAPDESTLKALSPALLVDKDTPPTFLWATSEDTLVPVENTIRMSGALARNGIPFESHIFERGAHGLSLSDQASAADQTQIDTDAAKWIPLVESWLLKRFALELPEAPQWTF